jgi:hypothetical protein
LRTSLLLRIPCLLLLLLLLHPLSLFPRCADHVLITRLI